MEQFKGRFGVGFQRLFELLVNSIERNFSKFRLMIQVGGQMLLGKDLQFAFLQSRVDFLTLGRVNDPVGINDDSAG